MEQRRIPRPGQIYKHFKNNLYQIITVATHTETGERMVVYQALYGDFKTYVRPLAMFMEEVDKVKYPQAEQTFRFELVSAEDENEGYLLIESDLNNTSLEGVHELEEVSKQENVPVNENKIASAEYVFGGEEASIKTEESVNPILMEFLDASSYEEKLYILLNNKKNITDKILNDMSLAIDCTVGEGDIEDRIAEFAFCLQTHARFENKRLR